MSMGATWSTATGRLLSQQGGAARPCVVHGSESALRDRPVLARRRELRRATKVGQLSRMSAVSTYQTRATTPATNIAAITANETGTRPRISMGGPKMIPVIPMGMDHGNQRDQPASASPRPTQAVIPENAIGAM